MRTLYSVVGPVLGVVECRLNPGQIFHIHHIHNYKSHCMLLQIQYIDLTLNYSHFGHPQTYANFVWEFPQSHARDTGLDSEGSGPPRRDTISALRRWRKIIMIAHIHCLKKKDTSPTFFFCSRLIRLPSPVSAPLHFSAQLNQAYEQSTTTTAPIDHLFKSQPS